MFDLYAAPMRIARVRLKVRDLAGVALFYQEVLGLQQIKEEPGRVRLGTAKIPLLELIGDPSFTPRDPHSAGLFHTAFLLPSRGDLARWLAFVVERGVRLNGASDHGVSEAIYLADPEGNGIEVYADRPVADWVWVGEKLQMGTDPLDLQDLISAASDGRWSGMPEGGMIGHVHLQVGEIAAAERFYQDILGFDVTSRYPGASFFGAGGYHHQLAANIWNSRGAGERAESAAGLDGFELIMAEDRKRAVLHKAQQEGALLSEGGEGAVLRDPWKIGISLRSRL